MTTKTDASALAIRPAQPADVSAAVGLLYLTMHGLADYIFGCDPRHPTLEVVQALFLQADNRLSHRHAAVIEAGAAPAGLLVAYPGKLVPALDRATGSQLLRRFGPAAFVRLVWRALALPGEEARRDEYYISNLGVLPQLQGQGIGSRLLNFAERQARAAGLSRLSLCVDMDNTGAQRLYERTGFRVVLRQAHSARAAQAGRGYLRMVKVLAPA
jgi:ribosomal protein S18 acetylase RimI-like enzyme